MALLPQDHISVRGDTIKLSFKLWEDKTAGTPWDLTGAEIRFQLNTPTVIKKATASVTGGSASQITIDNASLGLFSVNILKTETGILLGDYTFEIEVTKANGDRTTVLQSTLRVLADYITWSTI